ncbi:MAG: STAS domain-containing protein [Coraliomargaritaceae bacterium]
MKATPKPAFLVNSSDSTVFILIEGKANFLNANTFKQFIDNSLSKKISHYIVDFEHCTGMDSTFLGIIAWLGLQIKQSKNKSYLIVRNLNKRNKELFNNLGLQNFIATEEAILEAPTQNPDQFQALEEAERFEAIDILNAHKNLVKARKENASLFKDLINILEDKIQSD